MAYEQKDNSGSLFKNERKEREAQPDYTGKALIDGTFKQVSAWLSKTKTGKTYMSLRFKDDEERPKPINNAEGDGYTPATPPETDDIPW